MPVSIVLSLTYTPVDIVKFHSLAADVKEMIQIKPPLFPRKQDVFPKGVTKNRNPKSILKRTSKFSQLDGWEDIGSTLEENEDAEGAGEDELDQTWEERVLSCHDPYFIPGFLHTPPPSPNELGKEEDKGDVVS